ncbi:DUF3048 domain-containing protein [Lentibacillus cibarius]|uniref:DUF3048 domain-containing protein n=1 Tax=Lentibacillus cibarius TaxID=2583219 RepID=A0A5S3QLG8_9BACI|nr:DUF3048 domain-containing protein [Lentibacillus cibarius]TMN22784.1 DUF3048 domain-containing protein [Lentibacillus cibarius]
MKKLFFFLMLAMLLLVAACSDKEGKTAEDNETKANETDEKEQAKASPKKAHTFPLTGVKTENPAEDRIVGVMVNNHRKARPQTGLSKADIVFEILAEGQITRFLALFQSEKPDVVGPVRSAREYYFELASGYGALYVYHGAANFVNDMIKSRQIEHLDGALYDDDGHLFERGSLRRAPHNSYLQFGAVYDVAQNKGYNITHSYEPLSFASREEAAAIKGDAANQVKIVYSNRLMNIVKYKYDKNSETYARYSDGEQTVERHTNEPITIDNIFIVETPHQVIDNAGRRAIDITSGGNAYLIQKGKIRKVQWENRDGRIIPVKDGEPVNFVAGKTWINIIPSNPGLSQSVTVTNE